MITFTYKVNKKTTINKYLTNKGYSSNNLYYLIAAKNVLVNDKVVDSKNFIVYKNDTIKLTLLDEENKVIPTNKDFKIVYEDEYILIINKDKGIDTIPTLANNENSLANYISYYYKSNNINSSIHFVNRLDKETSGLLIVAKNQYIHHLFSKTKIVKKYKALVTGNVRCGLLITKIKKEENSNKRIISSDGKLSFTLFNKIKSIDNNTLVNIRLLTGRTHQIRLSFASINHPLVGDDLYGTANKNSMMLISYYLKFIHPIIKKKIKISI